MVVAVMKESDQTPLPQPLDYPSPPLSPYDRPIEPFVTFARRFRFAVRMCYLLVALLVVGFLVWGALRAAGALDRVAQ